MTGLRRTFDPSLLTEVVNHPDVRPWIAPGADKIDLTASIVNPRNFALMADGGGFLLICHEPGIYEVHTQFLPDKRSGTVAAMRDGFDYMFTRTDCERVTTQVPDSNPAAAALAVKAGFRPMFRREAGPMGPTNYMGLSVDEWAQDNSSLETDGEWFRDQLEAAGSKAPTHTHDPAHKRAVGAAVRMVRAGNAAKGVIFYNRWARLAGYLPITLVSLQPVVLDLVDAVVGLHSDQMDILLCR